MRIKILSIAEGDIEEGYRFYESQADGLGTYFLETLYPDIDSLSSIVAETQAGYGKNWPSDAAWCGSCVAQI